MLPDNLNDFMQDLKIFKSHKGKYSFYSRHLILHKLKTIFKNNKILILTKGQNTNNKYSINRITEMI